MMRNISLSRLWYLAIGLRLAEQERMRDEEQVDVRGLLGRLGVGPLGGTLLDEARRLVDVLEITTKRQPVSGLLR